MQLNMFRASSCPSSGATTTAVAASGLPSELGDSAVGRGLAGCTKPLCVYQLQGKTSFLNSPIIEQPVNEFTTFYDERYLTTLKMTKFMQRR